MPITALVKALFSREAVDICCSYHPDAAVLQIMLHIAQICFRNPILFPQILPFMFTVLDYKFHQYRHTFEDGK